MKHLKSFKQFEDVSNATTSGMGAVVASQPSSLPGALNGPAFVGGGWTSGSGDVGFPLVRGSEKRKKRKIKNVKIENDTLIIEYEKETGALPAEQIVAEPEVVQTVKKETKNPEIFVFSEQGKLEKAKQELAELYEKLEQIRKTKEGK